VLSVVLGLPCSWSSSNDAFRGGTIITTSPSCCYECGPPSSDDSGDTYWEGIELKKDVRQEEISLWNITELKPHKEK
jgi:hypothetical protein